MRTYQGLVHGEKMLLIPSREHGYSAPARVECSPTKPGAWSLYIPGLFQAHGLTKQEVRTDLKFYSYLVR